MSSRFALVYAASAAAMAILFLSSIWAMTLIAGGTHGEGLTVGAFAAVWGGPGFGLMAAGSVLALMGEQQ